MKKIIIVIIFMPILSGCTSCINNVDIKGRVISNMTGEPIIGAEIKLKSENITVTTDDLGYFRLYFNGNGKPFKRNFVVAKTGYKDFEIEFDYKKSQNVYKINDETYYYCFNNGMYLCPDTINYVQRSEYMILNAHRIYYIK